MTPVAAKTTFVTLRDVVALTKPRITLMVVLTTATGMFVAPAALPWPQVVLMLLATATVVSAANSLNCYLERDSDRLMERTRLRPLPDRRLDPNIALALGVVLGAVSVGSLYVSINGLTAVLGGVALLSYVLLYTPMKPHSSAALLVGAVPGALPPLMGWTAATGRLDLGGLVLFAVLFFWQIPHFIAIAIVRRDDYARAGLRTLPADKGLPTALRHAFGYAVILVPISLVLYPVGAAGLLYLIAALAAGVWQAVVAFRALRSEDVDRAARRIFGASLVYLPVVQAALILDAL